MSLCGQKTGSTTSRDTVYDRKKSKTFVSAVRSSNAPNPQEKIPFTIFWDKRRLDGICSVSSYTFLMARDSR